MGKEGIAAGGEMDVNTALQEGVKTAFIRDSHTHGIPKAAKASDKEWVGLCKTDREGNPYKGAGCSCVVFKAYRKESRAKGVIEEHFRCKE
ncbi:unnamed protein product [Nyctereutes procyonoides]|uniref:(raccoon dog) hypothetical protein n=1 Tax=Nyctereutes procyonoides TaxID=34880 RepID=A0A811YY21_NYCPR|nr:unnamed protein product [Nyctereutes procyonoides]